MSRARTKEERDAITALHNLAAKWPKTLGLFSWSGSLTVIRLDDNGEFPIDDKDTMNAATLATINGIKNDGGCP